MSSSIRQSILYSQNFLKNPCLVASLFDRLGIDSDDIVYEIGPGKGIITEQLALRHKQVIAIEKDPRLSAFLLQKFADRPNVTIHAGDFLHYPLPCKPYKVFANIPFNITTAIVTRLTTAEHPPEDAYLTMQKEAAAMFLGKPHESLRTILLKPWFEMDLVSDMRLLMVGKVQIRNKIILVEKHKRAPIIIEAGSEKLVDLSHTIEHGLVTYKGLPAPIICDYLSREESRKQYAPGTEFQIGKIEMVTNTGTYLDCPFHRYEHGKDLSEVAVDRLADLEGIVIRADHKETFALDTDFFRNKELRGRAVLEHTGWDTYWKTNQYFEHHPHLTEDAARYLVECGVKLVGIDSVNIDDTRGGERPVHSLLLGAEVLIVEHMCNLGQLPDEGFTFSALPPKFKGAGTFPVRALAKVR
jgi:arylformamidase